MPQPALGLNHAVGRQFIDLRRGIAEHLSEHRLVVLTQCGARAMHRARGQLQFGRNILHF